MTAPTKRILLLGADGFLGRHFAFRFRQMGHEVLCSARRVSRLQQMGFEVLQADLNDPASHQPDTWRTALKDVDFVVNLAGLLSAPDKSFQAVHVTAPAAIYAALPATARGVLISAVGTKAATPFALYRRLGEEVARAAPIPMTILRPGLVLADTSYGGSSLVRALAALPFLTPVIGDGQMAINPIHAVDLADVVLEVLAAPPDKDCLEIGGPEQVSQAGMFQAYRRWLGLRPQPLLHIPLGVARLLGRVGDFLRLGPISTVAIAQLEAGIKAETSPELARLAVKPRGFSDILASRPAATQDLWQARLYFLSPALRFGLALMWLISGLLGLFLSTSGWLAAFGTLGLPDNLLIGAARLGGVVDLGIAWALLRNFAPRRTGLVQLAVVLGYSIGLTVLLPSLWLDPFGGLLKNLPVLLAILVWMQLEDER